MKKFKVGIAGFGIVGKRRRQCIDQNPHLELVAVCDRNFYDNGLDEHEIHIYSNYNDLLKENLDIIFICLTNDIAAEVTIAGLEQGLHVFCEKPPGRNLDDIAQVIACEKKYPNLKLMYGFNHRYHESVQDALEIVSSGELGKMLNLSGVYGKSQLTTFDQLDWRTKRSIAGGGILLDQGIHMVDLMCLFSGPFSEVHSFISNNFWNYDVEDNAYALMRTESGVVAILHSSGTHWRHRFNLEMTLERGAIILSGILSGSKSYGAETMTVIWAGTDDQGEPKEQMTRYNHDPSWQSEIDVFTRSIIKDEVINNGSSAEALATMNLVYDIYCADANWKSNYNLSNIY